MPPDPDYQFLYKVIKDYVDGLFKKDGEARDAALHALELSQRSAASKVEFYVVALLSLISLIVAILKK